MHYTKDDIPVGPYALEVKKMRRSVQEKFLVHLIELQPLNSSELCLTSDELYDEYQHWVQEGKEFDRSKQSFLTWFNLKQFDLPGIDKRRVERKRWEDEHEGSCVVVDGVIMSKSELPSKTQWVTEYRFALDQLRSHYRLETAKTATSATSSGDGGATAAPPGFNVTDTLDFLARFRRHVHNRTDMGQSLDELICLLYDGKRDSFWAKTYCMQIEQCLLGARAMG